MLMIAKPASGVNSQFLEAVVKKWIPTIISTFLIMGIGIIYAILKDGFAGVTILGVGIMLLTSILLLNVVDDLRNRLQNQPAASKARPPFYVPRDVEKFLIQQKLYWIIKPLREQKWPWKKIVAHLQHHYPDFPSDPKTLSNALKAGDAGYLDSWPPNLEDPAKRENPSTNFGNS